MSNEARREVENVSVVQVKSELEAGQDVLLVDVREIQERIDSGAIPGSVHVPRGMLEFWADPASEYYRDWFREDRRTILYCAASGRSPLAVKTLKDMGFTNVANLETGFEGWVAAGEPVEAAAATSRWMRKPRTGA